MQKRVCALSWTTERATQVACAYVNLFSISQIDIFHSSTRKRAHDVRSFVYATPRSANKCKKKHQRRRRRRRRRRKMFACFNVLCGKSSDIAVEHTNKMYTIYIGYKQNRARTQFMFISFSFCENEEDCARVNEWMCVLKKNENVQQRIASRARAPRRQYLCLKRKIYTSLRLDFKNVSQNPNINRPRKAKWFGKETIEDDMKEVKRRRRELWHSIATNKSKMLRSWRWILCAQAKSKAFHSRFSVNDLDCCECGKWWERRFTCMLLHPNGKKELHWLDGFGYKCAYLACPNAKCVLHTVDSRPVFIGAKHSEK